MRITSSCQIYSISFIILVDGLARLSHLTFSIFHNNIHCMIFNLWLKMPNYSSGVKKNSQHFDFFFHKLDPIKFGNQKFIPSYWQRAEFSNFRYEIVQFSTPHRIRLRPHITQHHSITNFTYIRLLFIILLNFSRVVKVHGIC